MNKKHNQIWRGGCSGIRDNSMRINSVPASSLGVGSGKSVLMAKEALVLLEFRNLLCDALRHAHVLHKTARDNGGASNATVSWTCLLALCLVTWPWSGALAKYVATWHLTLCPEEGFCPLVMIVIPTQLGRKFHHPKNTLNNQPHQYTPYIMFVLFWVLDGGFKPFEKYSRQIGSFPQVGGQKIWNIWVATS